MSIRWVLTGLGVLSLSSVWAAAPPRSDSTQASNLAQLTAEQIVARNLAARGGAPAWAAIHTMQMSGKLDAGRERKDGGAVVTSARQAKARERSLAEQIFAGKAPVPTIKVIRLPFKLDLQRPNRMRLEIPFQGDTAVQTYDGRNGWKLRPFLGRHDAEAFNAEELAVASEQQELDGPLANLAAKGTKVAVDGTDVIEGHPAYRLKLTLKSGAVRRLWIDGQSFLDVKFEGRPRRFDGKLRPVYTYYRDYRPEHGLMVAHRLETAVEGVGLREYIDIEKVAFNIELSGAQFGKPL